MINEHSAGFVIYRMENNEKKFLVLHYPSGHIDFPKGHLEEGETAIQAAKRELEEETGIKNIKVIPGFEDEIVYQYRRNGVQYSKKVTYFLCQTSEKQVKISHEHKGYFWFNYEESLKHITFQNSKDILIKAEKFLTQK